MADAFHIVLYDKDGVRLNLTALCFKKYLKLHHVNATLEPVGCHLEISRQGLESPAITINRVLVSAKQALDEARLEDFAQRLARMQKASD